MSDLTKLTPEDLMIRMGPVRWHEHSDVWAEIRRRLKLLEQCEALIDWLLENPWCRPIETNAGTWIVQKYVGHTLARANTKREVVDAARAALDGK